MGAYGVDVLDMAVSPRRIAVLLERLPPAGRRQGQQWSTEAELLALLIDHVAALTYVTLKAHGAKNLAKPRPLPRPGASSAGAKQEPAAHGQAPAPGAAKAGSWADAAALLAGMTGMGVSGGQLQLRQAHHPGNG
jgi:hypothetical protein